MAHMYMYVCIYIYISLHVHTYRLILFLSLARTLTHVCTQVHPHAHAHTELNCIGSKLSNRPTNFLLRSRCSCSRCDSTALLCGVVNGCDLRLLGVPALLLPMPPPRTGGMPFPFNRGQAREDTQPHAQFAQCLRIPLQHSGHANQSDALHERQLRSFCPWSLVRQLGHCICV